MLSLLSSIEEREYDSSPRSCTGRLKILFNDDPPSRQMVTRRKPGRKLVAIVQSFLYADGKIERLARFSGQETGIEIAVGSACVSTHGEFASDGRRTKLWHASFEGNIALNSPLLDGQRLVFGNSKSNYFTLSVESIQINVGDNT
jgi:hypothetical protein